MWVSGALHGSPANAAAFSARGNPAAERTNTTISFGLYSSAVRCLSQAATVTPLFLVKLRFAAGLPELWLLPYPPGGVEFSVLAFHSPKPFALASRQPVRTPLCQLRDIEP
jgi:hypothetical protein